MWLLIGFAVHHVYSAMLMAQVEANGTMESILSGWKFVPPEDLVYSGYRFSERRKIHEEAEHLWHFGADAHGVLSPISPRRLITSCCVDVESANRSTDFTAAHEEALLAWS